MIDSVTDDSLEFEGVEIEEPSFNDDLPRKFWLLKKEYFAYNNDDLGAGFISLPLSNKEDFSQKKKSEAMRRAIQRNGRFRVSPISVTNYSQRVRANDALISFDPATRTILIGIAKSGYIKSYLFGEDKKDPYYHLLRVDWRIKRKFDLPPELLNRHFVSSSDASSVGT